MSSGEKLGTFRLVVRDVLLEGSEMAVRVYLLVGPVVGLDEDGPGGLEERCQFYGKVTRIRVIVIDL